MTPSPDGPTLTETQMPVVGDGASKVIDALFFANPAQHLFVQRADELREPLPDHLADDLGGGCAPERERPPIGVDDAPFAIQGVEGVTHAFQDGLGIRRQSGRSRFHGPKLFRGDHLRVTGGGGQP